MDLRRIIQSDDASGLSLEPSPRAVRAARAGETVADSKRAVILRERGRPPVYGFPLEDVGTDVLPDSAWTSLDGPGGGPYVVIARDAVDEWFEEDERLVGGLRDPYHRVDAVWSERSVRVVLAGTVLAETTRPCLVFETGYPTRFYVSPDDVRSDLLSRTSTRTECPYKGVASYWSATVRGRTVEDVAWSYDDPLPTQPKLAGLLSFWPERVDAIEVDGVAVSSGS